MVDFLSILLSRSGFDNLVVFRVLRAARFTKISKISRLSYHAMGKTEEEEEAAVEKDFIGRIIGYDPDNLFSLGYMVNLSGTVLAMPEIWIQFVFLAILTAIWAANICKKRCDPGHGGFVPNDPECNGCVDGFESSTGLMFTSIVAFLLGLFDSMTFDRWWSTRIMLSNLLETSVNSAFFLANYVPSNDEVSVYCRRTIVRYLNLAFVLAFREMNEGNCEDNLKDLIPQYMTISEAKFLESESNKYSRVYLWACILLTRLSAIEKVMCPVKSSHHFCWL